MKELREGLAKLTELLSQWQAKAAALEDFARLQQLLSTYDDITVKAFCDRVEKSLADVGAVAVRTPKPAPPAKEIVVRSYLSELEQAGIDYQLFDAVMKRLEKDKKARVQELEKIATEYCRTPIKVDKKSDAFDAIRYRHRNVATAPNRNRDLGGIF